MLRCYWQVTAGMIPGEIDPKHTRRYEITSHEWAQHERSGDPALLVMSRSLEAAAYASMLQLRSSAGREPNWVTIEYAWM